MWVSICKCVLICEDDSNEMSMLHIRGSDEAAVAEAYKEWKELFKLK